MFFKKIILIALLFSIQGSAAVFDYRIYYGDSLQNDSNVEAYSASVYSYLHESDISFGAQGDWQPKLGIGSASILAGYDLSRVHRIEANIGKSFWLNSGTYKTGYHYSGTYLMQTNLESYLEALQVGFSVKYDIFEKKKERQLQFFIGFGF